MSVEPREMTKEGRAWVRRLHKVLMSAPDTVELMTIGDAHLTVLCKQHTREVFAMDGGIEDGKTSRNGCAIGSLRSACLIHGVSG